MTDELLSHPLVGRLVELALEEDLVAGDATTRVLELGSGPARGRIVARENLVLAGLPVAGLVFQRLGAQLQLAARDGQSLPSGAATATVTGPAPAILAAERTALNFLQRLSGIATRTRQFVDAVEGTGARIVDTRKTTPGWRILEKHAVRCGGGANHRFHLGDGILIKDNHIAAVGSVGRAVRRARARAPHTLRIEVEVDGLGQLEEALEAGAEVVLLDNMEPDQLREAVRLTAGKALLEASGGVTLQRVRAIAESGVDLVSIGALTHSARAVDLALDWT